MGVLLIVIFINVIVFVFFLDILIGLRIVISIGWMFVIWVEFIVMSVGFGYLMV